MIGHILSRLNHEHLEPKPISRWAHPLPRDATVFRQFGDKAGAVSCLRSLHDVTTSWALFDSALPTFATRECAQFQCSFSHWLGQYPHSSCISWFTCLILINNLRVKCRCLLVMSCLPAVGFGTLHPAHGLPGGVGTSPATPGTDTTIVYR